MWARDYQTAVNLCLVLIRHISFPYMEVGKFFHLICRTNNKCKERKKGDILWHEVMLFFVVISANCQQQLKKPGPLTLNIV